MRLLRFVRRHPVAILGLLALAFFTWVWMDAGAGRRPGPDTPPELSRSEIDVPPGDWAPPQRRLPVPPGVEEKSRPTPQDTAQVLPKLKPGMTRTEVEGLVGVPAARDILPATIADGKVTYHTAYEADLEPPATVRPIRTPRPLARDPRPNGRTLVTLEFDATKPGHPLLGIHYPDPLF